MARFTTALAVLLALAFIALGCRSQCHKLCARQEECHGSEAAGDEALDAVKRQQLCQTVCDGALHDPEREEAMQAAFACLSASCEDLRSCVQDRLKP